MLAATSRQNLIHVFKPASRGPTISHLQFVDDTLFFVELMKIKFRMWRPSCCAMKQHLGWSWTSPKENWLEWGWIISLLAFSQISWDVEWVRFQFLSLGCLYVAGGCQNLCGIQLLKGWKRDCRRGKLGICPLVVGPRSFIQSSPICRSIICPFLNAQLLLPSILKSSNKTSIGKVIIMIKNITFWNGPPYASLKKKGVGI